MTLEKPVGFGAETEPTEEKEEEANTGTGQDPESDLDEEQMEKPMLENQGRRYPLRERRFPDAERVLLTDEGELEIFEEAKRDTHNRKWLSAM